MSMTQCRGYSGIGQPNRSTILSLNCAYLAEPDPSPRNRIVALTVPKSRNYSEKDAPSPPIFRIRIAVG